MKKALKIAGIVIAAGLLLFVILNWRQLSYKAGKNGNTLVSMTIRVAAENESGVVEIDYPYYTYSLQKGDAAKNDRGGRRRAELDRSIRDKDIPVSTIKRLFELVEEMEADPSSESNKTHFDEKNYTYHVRISYRDSLKNLKQAGVTGYDALPQCWPEFASLVNGIIEVDALDANPELLHFSEEWYKETFAIDDSVFVYGSFADMVKTEKLGMSEIIGSKYWNPMSPIIHYEERFTALSSDELDKYAAHEIQTVYSSEEEFKDFVESYLRTLFGENYDVDYLEADDGTLFGAICRDGHGLKIYRSCVWQPEDAGGGFYAEVDDSGPEGMFSVMAAYYSPDGKYCLVTPTRQEKYFSALAKDYGRIPHVILDCDIGWANDDMLALTMLLKAEKAGLLHLTGITLEGGNTFISADYENYGELQENQKKVLKNYLEWFDREDIPVITGTDYPEGYDAAGVDSLADFYGNLLYLQDSDTYGAVHFFRNLSSGELQDSNDARDFLISEAAADPGNVVIIAIGPTMNIARAVEKDPSFAGNVRAIYYMGGAFGGTYNAEDTEGNSLPAVGGANITPYAEYNVCYDAVSFEKCITAGFPEQYISPAEVNVYVPGTIFEDLAAANTEDDRYADFWLDVYGEWIQDYPYWDPIAAAAFLSPENMHAEERYVTVNTDRGDAQYAMTSAITEDEYALLPDSEKALFGKAELLSAYDGFWDYTIALLCG